MSPVLAWANLDFEYELAAGTAYRPQERVLRRAQHWRHVLRLLPEAREAEVLDPHRPRARDATGLVVWGVTARTRELASQLGLAAELPTAESVRGANDKLVSHEIEVSLGLSLPFSRRVSRLDELEVAIRECPHDWVLKHPFGVSARERAVGRAGGISSSALGWARGRLSQGWELLFEPWVEQALSSSMHFEVTRRQEIRYLGHCQLLTDAGGVYRGNRVVASDTLETSQARAGAETCQKLASMGYWGLVGIDSLRGRLGDLVVSRPLVEINARCSFGRLALALAEWLPQGWSYLWWHPRPVEAARLDQQLPPLGSVSPKNVRPGIYALPCCADPEGVSGTAVLAAPTPEELESLEKGVAIR